MKPFRKNSTIYRFLHNISRISGSKAALFLFKMFPAELNNCSEGTEVARMQRSLLAIEDSLGYLWLLSLHHLHELFKSGTTCFALYVATFVSTSLVSSGEDPFLSLVSLKSRRDDTLRHFIGLHRVSSSFAMVTEEQMFVREVHVYMADLCDDGRNFKDLK